MERTSSRVGVSPTVDQRLSRRTSDFDYTSLAECEGLGVIGTNQTGAKSRGLHLHTTFAVAPNGLPLGILRAECVAPQLKSPDDRRPSYAVPIEEKDTFSWVAGLRDTVEAVQRDRQNTGGLAFHPKNLECSQWLQGFQFAVCRLQPAEALTGLQRATVSPGSATTKCPGQRAGSLTG